MKKFALTLLIALNVVTFSYADSPLTSTDFSEAYKTDPVVVKAGITNGILTQELFNFLVDETRAIDLKMALINKLSWSIDGKDNAGLFIDFGKKSKKWKDYEVFIENATAEELLCYAYLKSLDDYFDVDQALNIATIAVILKPNSYTFNIIHALIQAQSIFENVDNWCAIYSEPNNIRFNETLERDMKIEAEEIIFEYLQLYQEYCIEEVEDFYNSDQNVDYEEITPESYEDNESIEYVEEPYDDSMAEEIDEFSMIMDQLISSSYLINKTEGLYDRIVANGGSGFDFALEGCPDPATYGCLDFSETYDFVLFEIYPDRNVTIDRFSYIPETGIFMLYDIVNDTYVPFPEE